MADVNEHENAEADGFNVIGFQQWYRKLCFSVIPAPMVTVRDNVMEEVFF